MLAHSLGSKKVEVKEKESFCEHMRPVMRHLNKKVHDLGDKLCSQNDEITDVNFDLESFICQVDSEMWESLSILTQSRTERKRTDTHLQKRRLRTAYLLSVILFDTTAGHCKFPFHVILSDFVEASSGSAQLITVLNRLGAVASKSSLNRHIMKHSAKHLEEGLLKLLKNDVFTVATVDNIDFLQSNAAVYAGSQHRSWHGTSVQVVQPQSGLKVLLPLQPACACSSPCRTPGMSTPMDIPSQDLRSPAPKRIRYARTFQEMGLPSSKAIQPLKPGARLTRAFNEVNFSGFMKSNDETMLLEQLIKLFFCTFWKNNL